MLDRDETSDRFHGGRVHTREKIDRLVGKAIPGLTEDQIGRVGSALTSFWSEVITASQVRALIFATAPGLMNGFFLIPVLGFSPNSRDESRISAQGGFLTLKALESLQETAWAGAGVVILSAFEPPNTRGRNYRSLLDSLPFPQLYGVGAEYLGVIRSRSPGAR